MRARLALAQPLRPAPGLRLLAAVSGGIPASFSPSGKLILGQRKQLDSWGAAQSCITARRGSDVSSSPIASVPLPGQVPGGDLITYINPRPGLAGKLQASCCETSLTTHLDKPAILLL